MQYWKLKSQHRQSSQKSPHSNCHTSTPSFSTTTSFPMLDTATSNITTTINNNGIIGDIANVDKDDGNGSDVMMDVVVNSNAAANVNNIVDIDDNNYNDYNAAVHVALQQLHQGLCDNPKAKAPEKGLMVGNIIDGLKLQIHMA